MKSGQMAGVNKELQSACGERAPVSWLMLTPLVSASAGVCRDERAGQCTPATWRFTDETIKIRLHKKKKCVIQDLKTPLAYDLLCQMSIINLT